jgi:DNA-binding transcriptional ArsR family regulator
MDERETEGGMISLAMQLGLAPIPRSVPGKRYSPEAKKPAFASAESREAAAVRRADILHLLQREPMTKQELIAALDASLDAVSKALHRLMRAGLMPTSTDKYWQRGARDGSARIISIATIMSLEVRGWGG